MVFTIYPEPGLDISKLKSFGVDAEYLLFTGRHLRNNDWTHIYWGTHNYTVQGREK